MEYASNILPTEAAYYMLTNASIVGGRLNLSSKGSAKCTITEDMLAKATENFQLILAPEEFTNNYAPQVYMDVCLYMDTGECYSYSMCPVYSNGILTAEVKFQSGTYKKFEVTLRSEQQITLLLWELCPEASDADVQVIIDGVKQSLPRLLYDYNMWPLTVQQEETTIGLISYNLLDATDIQGHFEVTYVASKGCVLTLRFKDMDNTELYTPLLFDIKPGRGSIGVPHAYLDRVAGMHTASVTAQVTQGQLSIGIRGIMFTIDGGYLAERVIDLAADVQDIGIKQTQAGYDPEEIWTVGIDAGEVLVKSRPYKTDKIDTAFTPQFSLGEGKHAALEFNGYWYLAPGHNNYTIITEEIPWVFWVDTNDVLWLQQSNEGSTKQQIDTNVTYVRACRAYKSELYKNQDQGIICLYLQNGRAYYTQYVYDAGVQVFRWTAKIEVDSSLTNIIHCSIGRLNDYRVQITLVTSETVKCYISDRTYVNQATPRENINLSLPETSPFAYCPPDVDTSISLIRNSISKDHLTLSATFDKVLIVTAYHNIKDFITFNASIPDYDIESGKNYVKNITLQTDSVLQESTITVELNLPPTQLITEMYINKSVNYCLQEEIAGYGTWPVGPLSAQWDTTNYIDSALKESITLRNPSKVNFMYRGILDITASLKDSIELIVPDTKFAYRQLIKSEHTGTEAISLIIPVTNFAYTATTIKPI